MNVYCLILLTLLVVTIIIYLLSKIYLNNNKVIFNVDNNKTLEELMEIVKFYCKDVYNNTFLTLFNDNGYRAKDKNIEIGKIINDKILNEAIINTSNLIIENMSISFKKKLFIFIEKKKLESFIVFLVRDNLTQLALQLNENTAKKMRNS